MTSSATHVNAVGSILIFWALRLDKKLGWVPANGAKVSVINRQTSVFAAAGVLDRNGNWSGAVPGGCRLLGGRELQQRPTDRDMRCVVPAQGWDSDAAPCASSEPAKLLMGALLTSNKTPLRAARGGVLL
jgi:hypothetical protein